MRKFGCLLIGLICFVSIVGVYAFNIIEKDDVHTPDYYESNVRSMFGREQWEAGKQLLDEGLSIYPDVNGLNELCGRYHYRKKDYDTARYFLVRAVRDNPENVEAKQLLIKVEDETRNYSSAICYVNELLEINPYWQGLWRKKIELYRKQGNVEEADRLLRRLRQIYPNDSTVQRDYVYRLEESFQERRKSGDKEKAVALLRDLVEVSPQNEGYYLDLVNLLLQQGNTEEAIQTAGVGVSRIPRSSALIIKKASILAEEARYQEAMAFVKSRMRTNRDGHLVRFYNLLLAEAANAARMNDPYVLYGKVYETSKSDEALDYMLNTAVTRGYNDDALYYLAEAKRRRGEQTSLLYKEYLVYKRMGNTAKAYTLLSNLVKMNPEDADLADEFARNQLQQASELVSDGFYAEALPYLKGAVRGGYDDETKLAALDKTYACYYELRRYDDALAVLDSIHEEYPDYGGYFVKKADVFSRRGQTSEALDVLNLAMSDTVQTELYPMYAAAYEEIAIPYIKELIERGASGRAFGESVHLLEVNPSSYEGLQYAIGMSDRLDRHEDYDAYVSQARSIYPEDIDFIVKQAASYSRTEDYRRAVDLLRPQLDDYPDNDGLVGAFAENSELMALQLIKEHEPDSAITVADTALLFDENNESLLLAKGTAYEAMHRYDSAYFYQRKYKPGIEEAESFKRHIDGLLSRSYRNEISLEYLQGRYGEEDVITSVASASYIRKNAYNLFTGRINYAGRDGSTSGGDPEDQVSGGVGLQLQGGWEHRFSRKWAGTLTAAWANKYFPKITVGLQAAYEADNGLSLDIHAMYRRISTYSKTFRWDDSYGEGGWVFNGWDRSNHNLFSAGLGLSKVWNQVLVGGKADAYLLSSRFYVNASARLKYYPLEDGRTNITVMGAVGTAPEADMIDYAMPSSFDRLNTMVGLGGTYMFNSHLSGGVMGTWHTFYTQLNNRTGTRTKYVENIDTRYKNLYNVYLQLFIHF